MALSLNKLKRLGDASLTELFEQDRKLWTAMAKDAYGYTKKFIGADVRPDDVVPTLVPALEVSEADPELLVHLVRRVDRRPSVA